MFPEVVDTRIVRQTVTKTRYLLRMDQVQGYLDGFPQDVFTDEGERHFWPPRLPRRTRLWPTDHGT